MLSGFSIATGSFSAGTLLLALSGVCDMMDGIIARASGRITPFGAFLDSFLDRYADFFPLCGLVIFGFSTDNLPLVLLSLFSMAGAFATSYARARAESLGADCRSGIAERPERFLILLLALLSGFLVELILVLAVISNLTALQRLLCAAEKLRR